MKLLSTINFNGSCKILPCLILTSLCMILGSRAASGDSEKKIKILSTRDIDNHMSFRFTDEILDFCQEKGIEVISQNYHIGYWNKNHVVYEMPSDLSVGQLPSLETLMETSPTDRVSGLRLNDNTLFQFPPSNYEFLDEFAEYVSDPVRLDSALPQKIEIELRTFKSPSRDDIRVASTKTADSYPNNFWFITGIYETEIDFRGKRSKIIEQASIYGGSDAHFKVLKKIREETPFPTLLVAPGNLLRTDEAQAVPISKILEEIVQLKYTAINSDYREVELLNRYSAKDLEGLQSLLDGSLPFISANLFYAPAFHRHLVEKGILKENNHVSSLLEAEEERVRVFPPYLIREVDGIKMGFVGVTDFDTNDELPEIRDHFFVSNDFELIQKSLKELRKKVDIIVMLANMNQSETTNLAYRSGSVDIFISRSIPTTWPLPTALKKEITVLAASKDTTGDKHPVVINTTGFAISDVQLVFDKGTPATLKRVEASAILLDQNTAIRDEKTSWPYWQHLIAFFERARGDYLLPDPKEVFRYSLEKEKEKQTVRFLSAVHFWNFASSTLARLANCEIGFFPLKGLGSTNIGPLAEPFIVDWLSESGNLLILELSGSELIGLIQRVKSTKRFSPYKYILTGLDQILEPDYLPEKDITSSAFTIHQKTINPGEKYSIVTTDKLIEKTSLVPELAHATNVRRSFIFKGDAIRPMLAEDQSLSIQKTMIDYMKFSREAQKKEIRNLLLDELPDKFKSLTDRAEPLIKEKVDKLTRDVETSVAAQVHERTNLALLDLFEGRGQKQGPYTLVNFKNLGFTFKKTNIENNENFASVQNSRITTLDTTMIGFSSNVYFEMYDKRYSLTLGNKTDFVQTTYFIPDAENFEAISQDLTVSYAEMFGKLFALYSPSLGLNAGPFYQLAYETQLKEPEDTDRRNSVVMIAGPKIAGGYLLSEAKIGGIADFDYSSGTDNQEYGFYASAELTLPLFSGRATLENETELKYFLDSGEDDAGDLGVEWSVDSQLILPFLGDFYFAPFVSFLLFTGKINDETGYGIDFGISFQFSRYWKPQFQPFLHF